MPRLRAPSRISVTHIPDARVEGFGFILLEQRRQVRYSSINQSTLKHP